MDALQSPQSHEKHGGIQEHNMLTSAEQPTGDATGLSGSEADTAFSQEKPNGDALRQAGIDPPLPPTAPDGGSRAWLQVLGGFIIYFNTWSEPSRT